jgi:hypothetical protein
MIYPIINKVRSWANNERESVQKWVEQQRLSIKKERKRATNDIMTTQRKKRQEGLEERAASAAANSQKRLRAEIEALSATLQKQKIDNDVSKSRCRLNEKRLRDLISERDETIDSLRKDNEALDIKCIKLETERDDLLKFKSDTMKKKKKKKKHIVETPPSKNMYDTQSGREDIPNTQKVIKKKVDGDSINIQNDQNDRCTNRLEANEHKNSEEDIQKEIITCQESQQQQCDEEAIRVITNHQDLIEEPTEEWLQKHLQGINHQNPDTSDHSYITPMKGKKYKPEKYGMTPQREELPPQSSNIILKKNENGVQQSNAADRRVMIYTNGTRKETLPDGTVIVRFTNGDMKTTYSNIGITVYYYNESKVSNSTYGDMSNYHLTCLFKSLLTSLILASITYKSDISYYTSRWIGNI